MGSLRFSVIIPFLKDMEALQKCLQSLASQSLSPDLFEIIVVDNSAQDLLKGLKGENLKVIKEDVPGSYKARNAAISLARGERLAFIDDDCIAPKDWLEKAENYEADLVAGHVQLVYQGARPTELELYEDLFYFNQKEHVELESYGVTANLIVKKEVFESPLYFDGSLRSSGDRDFCLKAKEKGFQIEYAKDVMVSHPTRARWSQFLKRRVRIVAGQIYREYGQSPRGFTKEDLQKQKSYFHTQYFDSWVKNQALWNELNESQKIQMKKLSGKLNWIDRKILDLCYYSPGFLKKMTLIDRL